MIGTLVQYFSASIAKKQIDSITCVVDDFVNKVSEIKLVAFVQLFSGVGFHIFLYLACQNRFKVALM